MGPGGHLKQKLAWMFLEAPPDCPCHEHARQMDEWGPDECLSNMPTIMGWMKEGAEERKLPWNRVAEEGTYRLVRLCIFLARRDSKREMRASRQ